MRDILGHLLDGLSEKEVAGRLGLSPHTVHIHVTRMYTRLGVRSRAELFAHVYRRRHAVGANRAVSDAPVRVEGAVRSVAPVAAEAPPDPEHAGAARSRTTVLLVDDHADTLAAIGRLLTHAGFDVLTAATYHDALLTARTVRAHVLVADVGLPDGNGLELLAEMRRMYPASGIVLSGYAMPLDKSAAADAGFVHYLTKPVDLEQLVRAIRDAARAAFAPVGVMGVMS